MTKDEALNLAFAWYGSGNQDPDEFERIILSIVAQREQDGECKHCTDGCPACDARKLPEQEPVAWGVFEGNLHDMFFSQEEAQKMADLKGTHAEVRPLYATPQRTWVGLTDEDRFELAKAQYGWEDLLFAAEAKLKEKNNG
jgi:hypothetical protein